MDTAASVTTMLDTVRVILVQDSASQNYNTQYLSLIIALLAVVLGPVISYVTTKMTIRSQVKMGTQQMGTQIDTAERTLRSEVLSRNRQEWINTLRDNISQFIALMMTISVSPNLRTQTADYVERVEHLSAIRYKIALLINPKEDDHKKLDTFLNETTAILFKPRDKRTGNRQLVDIRADIVNISQQILKREWARVKNVE